MQRVLKAYGLSFLLHFLFFMAYILLFGEALKYKKVVEIDLSLQSQELQNYTEAPHKEDKKHRSEEKHSERSIHREVKEQAVQKNQKAKESRVQNSQMQETPKESGQESKGLESKETHNHVGEGLSKTGGLSSEQGTTKGQESTSTNRGKDAKEEREASPEAYLREKLSVISSIVQKHISYPLIARKMGWEGRVVVCFLLRSDGRVENVHVEKSSGYEILDKSAVSTVQKVSGLFPKPPVDVLVRLPINYKLE
ncbi:TonB family protein [Hydrogenobacter thermophilus TK-6]|uniref:TonB family protein n=1 Tax=Hydrogenobacter thermophilus (strain DSM 6534 / IAM 12695 / TK-6) TaxID=608538 RepID=D3DFV6_HYDTT|nr:energy transducer TonB [Hydrogenobacter thermophilus]ADO44647.1 TonB family protein [Hydrogenobacter thermophilus TK-6]BAI68708.1 TonB family protein [Hydrogenobacter thermophilus TK-6]